MLWVRGCEIPEVSRSRFKIRFPILTVSKYRRDVICDETYVMIHLHLGSKSATPRHASSGVIVGIVVGALRGVLTGRKVRTYAVWLLFELPSDQGQV